MSIPVTSFYLMEGSEISDNYIKWFFSVWCAKESLPDLLEAVNILFDPWITLQVYNKD